MNCLEFLTDHELFALKRTLSRFGELSEAGQELLSSIDSEIEERKDRPIPYRVNDDS